LTKQPLIAVIDDDAPVRRAIENLLRSSNLEPLLYPSAEAFLADLSLVQVDLIISDIKMPGMTGIDLQATLAQRRLVIPIIFISAVLDEHIVERALANGAKLCLQKPFDERELMTAIAAILSRGQSRK
jgi:FixJ family two-component response regulator